MAKKFVLTEEEKQEYIKKQKDEIEYKKNKGKQKLSIIKFKLNILYMYTN